jgi:glutaredoxin 3
MEQVTIYSSNSCGYCKMAKQLLARRGVVPQELNVDTSPDRRAEMIERTGRRTLPQIFIGDRHIGGYDDLAALDRSGQLEGLV